MQAPERRPAQPGRDAVVHRLKRRTAPAAREKKPEAPAAQERPETPDKPSKLQLRPGEAVLAQIKGWARLRPATLYVTNFRVAMASFPGRYAWIPHEHIDEVVVRLGGKGLRLESSIELISIESRRRKSIAAVHEVIERYRASARRPGARYDAELVQEWADRSGDMWDSHTGQVRLLIRRHPIATFGFLGAFVAAAKLLGS